ncbi:MAG: hypothetical protein HY784_07960 [Chloroflexi bacterium]|nr:hypothetical protein [Chloroflexota bacterium]
MLCRLGLRHLELPAGRALLIPRALLVAGLLLLSCRAGAALRPRLLAPRTRPRAVRVDLALAVLIALPALFAAWQALTRLPAAAAFASAWDRQDTLIRSLRGEGLARVSLPPLSTPAGLDTVGPEADFWRNQCAANNSGMMVMGQTPPPPPSPAALAAAQPLEAYIGQAARLLGYRLDREMLHPGDTLHVTVFWLPQAATDRPYTVFVHLYAPQAGSLAQINSYPLQGSYPTTAWVYNAAFAETYALTLAQDAPTTGDAQIVLGLYDLQSGQRLPVSGADAGSEVESWVQFGRLRVER